MQPSIYCNSLDVFPVFHLGCCFPTAKNKLKILNKPLKYSPKSSHKSPRSHWKKKLFEVVSNVSTDSWYQGAQMPWPPWRHLYDHFYASSTNLWSSWDEKSGICTNKFSRWYFSPDSWFFVVLPAVCRVWQGPPLSMLFAFMFHYHFVDKFYKLHQRTKKGLVNIFFGGY